MSPSSIDPSQRVTYTASQVQQYLTKIRLPAKYRSSPLLTSPSPTNPAAKEAEALSVLSALIKYQIVAIPWENLDLHYSPHHTISLDPLHLFHKMVERDTGRGGYCMENTALLATVLRSLGFDVMTTGARVNSAIQPVSQSKSWTGPSFDGWNHMVTIVTVAATRYLVDVGFGSNGPTFPVPLTDSFTSLNVSPGHSLLLRRGHIPDNTHRVSRAQELWTYHLRFHDAMPWIPGYCFSEVEFLPVDFETMNFFVSRSPTSWFTYSVVCLKFLMDEDTEEMVGDRTLFGNEIKERRNGVSTELATIESEHDRIEALEKYLGVKLTRPEREGIKGMTSMIV